VIVALGTLAGTAIGAWLGRNVTLLYGRFFHFPVFAFHLDPLVVAEALLITGAASVGGTLIAVRRVMVLPAAEAMKPEPPARFQATLVDRLGIGPMLATATRMIFRYIERRPIQTLLTVFGISLATGVVILGSFSVDAIDHAMEIQFNLIQRQDIAVGLIEPSAVAALDDVRHLPGVRRCEPIRTVGARLRHGHRSRRVGVVGLRPGGELLRVIDIHARQIELPSDGIVLSKKLAQLLDVRLGDRVAVEVLEGERPIRDVIVTALVDDFAGTTAYMDLLAVRRMMREGDIITGAYIAADTMKLDDLYRELKNSPRVANVAIKSAAVQSFRKTIAENLLQMRMFNIAFAGAIAFGVVYNSARIALAERGRDLATLRVLGFTRAEVARILLGELALLTIIAVPFGLALGYGMAYFVIHIAYDTELFRLPLVVSRWTFGFAAAVTLSSAVLSGIVVGRRVAKLDMVAVLKSRE
jgi:putative ABC transport system permease protein